jgi:hypothetical protein
LGTNTDDIDDDARDAADEVEADEINAGDELEDVGAIDKLEEEPKNSTAEEDDEGKETPSSASKPFGSDSLELRKESCESPACVGFQEAGTFNCGMLLQSSGGVDGVKPSKRRPIRISLVFSKILDEKPRALACFKSRPKLRACDTASFREVVACAQFIPPYFSEALLCSRLIKTVA